MKKINEKGFVLVETLVVTVFVATVFTFLYINIIPLISKYEIEEHYDTIDTKYISSLVSLELRYYLSENFNSTSTLQYYMNNEEILDLTDCDVSLGGLPVFGTTGSSSYEKCKELREMGNIKKIYLTKYNLKKLKENIKNDVSFINSKNISEQTISYINYLPTYENIPSNSYYRVIIAFEDIYANDLLYYGTLELDLDY